MTNFTKITDAEILVKLVMPYDEFIKLSLDKIGVPHLVANNEFIVIEAGDANVISEIFSGKIIDESIGTIEPLEIINKISPFRMQDKSGCFIGARMGRPEKAKMRKLTGSPHTLFPIGEQGGRLRSFQGAFESNKITAEFPIYFCEPCNKQTIFGVCETCDKKTAKRYYCRTCGVINEQKCRHGPALA